MLVAYRNLFPPATEHILLLQDKAKNIPGKETVVFMNKLNPVLKKNKIMVKKII